MASMLAMLRSKLAPSDKVKYPRIWPWSSLGMKAVGVLLRTTPVTIKLMIKTMPTQLGRFKSLRSVRESVSYTHLTLPTILLV